jgi:hypothetical protein
LALDEATHCTNEVIGSVGARRNMKKKKRGSAHERKGRREEKRGSTEWNRMSRVKGNWVWARWRRRVYRERDE